MSEARAAARARYAGADGRDGLCGCVPVPVAPSTCECRWRRLVRCAASRGRGPLEATRAQRQRERPLSTPGPAHRPCPRLNVCPSALARRTTGEPVFTVQPCMCDRTPCGPDTVQSAHKRRSLQKAAKTAPSTSSSVVCWAPWESSCLRMAGWPRASARISAPALGGAPATGFGRRRATSSPAVREASPSSLSLPSLLRSLSRLRLQLRLRRRARRSSLRLRLRSRWRARFASLRLR